MITPKELARVTMTEQKKASAKNDLFAFYIGRPISYVLTVPFLYLKIKPNTISFLSFFPSIIGFLLLGFGSTKCLQIIGAVLFMIWNFMDGIDGNVARYTKQTSQLGTLWDATSGYLAMMLMYFAPGIAVMNVSETVMLGFVPDYYYIVLSGLTALFTMFSRLVMHKKILLFANGEGSELREKENYSSIRLVMLNLTSPSGFINLILIGAVIFGLLRVFSIVYFVIYIGCILGGIYERGRIYIY